MQLSQVAIILCRPDESRNIGSVCRAMLTMEIKRLRIVGERKDYDENQVKTLAVHAKTIWDSVEFFDTLEEASSDCVLIAGTTRRRGQKRKNALLLPEEFAKHVAKIPNTDQGPSLAVVFGNERTGLTDEELDVCTMGVTIPTSSDCGSLNLSHAVQIITYELYRANKASTISPGYTPISISALNKTIDVIIESLQAFGFFKQAGKKDMRLFWKSILSKAVLSKSEAIYLEKLFTKAAGLHSRNKADITSSDDTL